MSRYFEEEFRQSMDALRFQPADKDRLHSKLVLSQNKTNEPEENPQERCCAVGRANEDGLVHGCCACGCRGPFTLRKRKLPFVHEVPVAGDKFVRSGERA